MWYIFPQWRGIGYSSTSKYYEITDLDEAREYLAHPVLGARLLAITTILLQLEEHNPTIILGSPDDFKLKSCMTLFLQITGSPSSSVFQQVLDKFYSGRQDQKTLRLMKV